MRCHFSDGQEANILLIFGHVHCVPPIAVRDPELYNYGTAGVAFYGNNYSTECQCGPCPIQMI